MGEKPTSSIPAAQSPPSQVEATGHRTGFRPTDQISSSLPPPPPSPPSPSRSNPSQSQPQPQPQSAPTTAQASSSSTPLVPPPTPYPWTWRCHECHTEYRLACTRRCLECSHEYCTTATPTGTTPGSRARRRRFRRDRRRTCTAEFDYGGWAAWGAFRRAQVQADRPVVDSVRRHLAGGGGGGVGGNDDGDVNTDGQGRSGLAVPNRPDYNLDTFATWELTAHSSSRRHGRRRRLRWRPVSEEKRAEVARRKERMYLQGQHNCWLHCDFPSECLHTIHAAWVERRMHSADS